MDCTTDGIIADVEMELLNQVAQRMVSDVSTRCSEDVTMVVTLRHGYSLSSIRGLGCSTMFSVSANRCHCHPKTPTPRNTVFTLLMVSNGSVPVYSAGTLAEVEVTKDSEGIRQHCADFRH